MRNISSVAALVFVALFWGAPLQLVAQMGTSSMSMSLGRAGASSVGPNGRYLMPSPEMIRVEEFINYHRHELPLPGGDQRVRLDAQQLKLDSGKTVVQFGLSTPRAISPELIAPLNLVLVIDQSGSMSGQRIEKVKRALHSLMRRLRKHDQVTIVGFNNVSRVHLEATWQTDPDKIRHAIDNIHPNGSTNLHSGLMLGYRQAEANFDPERTNRVILLTDGRTNTGQLDLDTIASQSKEYNQKGIDLSTIGLGNDLNHDLLRRLAEAGRGLIHFVGDEADIEKTFVEEFDSLLAPAARKVKLVVDFGAAADAVKVFGYSPKRQGTKWVFQLDDLNHGATQVVMARVPEFDDLTIKAVLRYTDAISSKEVKQEVVLSPGNATPNRYNVKRNYAIAMIAQSIWKAASHSNDGSCTKASKRLQKGINTANRLINGADEHVRRVEEIAANYLENIQNSIERNLD